MSWKIKEHHRALLASEQGCTVKNWGGKLSVCLVYPNHYGTAMGNLGFQTVYALCNDLPDVVCERAFLPAAAELKEYAKSGSRLLSLESQRPLTDFDLVAFTVSFENDYLNIPTVFALAGIPPFAAERDASFPLVLAGGAALFLNPEPVAPLLDLIGVGEAESLLPELLAFLNADGGSEREEVLARVARIPGLYVPALYEFAYDGDRVVAIHGRPGVPERVQRVWQADLGQSATASTLFAKDAEFSDMYLMELSRGCPRGCRFCAAGFMYLPYRQRPLELLKEEVTRGLRVKSRLGLVAAAASDYRQLGELCRFIAEQGGQISVSSLRLDSLDEDLLELLHASGHKTLALAPEGGSQRLRDLVNKGISEEQILRACDILIDRDILNLKLYFIVGLPTETDADLEEMVALVAKIRQRVIAAAKANRRLGSIMLSVNPFVPKPSTPFQWCGMAPLAALEQKYAFLRRALAGLSNVKIQMEGLREAVLQAFLARGDRRLAPLLVRAHQVGSWKKAARELGIAVDARVCRTIPLEEILPWDVIGSGDRQRLLDEYRKAFSLE